MFNTKYAQHAFWNILLFISRAPETKIGSIYVPEKIDLLVPPCSPFGSINWYHIHFSWYMVYFFIDISSIHILHIVLFLKLGHMVNNIAPIQNPVKVGGWQLCRNVGFEQLIESMKMTNELHFQELPFLSTPCFGIPSSSKGDHWGSVALMKRSKFSS